MNIFSKVVSGRLKAVVLALLLVFQLDYTPSASKPVIAAPQGGNLIIEGHVLLPDGRGMPGVSIYRAFASYSGVVAAATDANGWYQSGPIYINYTELVRVWAEKPGCRFEPPGYNF